MMSLFVFAFCLNAYTNKTGIRVSMTNGAYGESCFITGISLWHLEIRYFLKAT